MIMGYVGDQIRRKSRRLLLDNIVMILFILGIIGLTFPYIMECVRGPFPMTVDQLAALNSKGDAPHRFVRVGIDETKLDPGAYQLKGGDAHRNDWYYFLHVDSHVLVIKAHDEQPPQELVGSLSNATQDRDMQDYVIPGISGRIEGTILPVMVDLSSYRTGLWVMAAIFLPLLLLAMWNIQKGIARQGDPLKHPMAKQLAALGPPEEIALAVDAEVREGGAKVGKVLATRSWLIRPTVYSVDMLYLGDIAWAYKHVTVKKTYGVTTGKSFATIVHDVRGKRWSFSLTQPQVDGLLRLTAHVPWAIIGFNAQLQTAWQKNRSAVLAEIEQRKQKLLANTEGDAGKEPPAS